MLTFQMCRNPDKYKSDSQTKAKVYKVVSIHIYVHLYSVQLCIYAHIYMISEEKNIPESFL